MKAVLSIILILFLYCQNLIGQNNGVTGYGNINIISVSASYSNDTYITAGGGVIINDNLILGAYLNALKNPYRYNFINTDSEENPFSTNPNSINTTINNIETGVTFGLNIAPEKPFQFTYKQKIGYSLVSIFDLLDYGDTGVEGQDRFQNNEFDVGGFNISSELELQLKIGSSFKIGVLLGHHFARINGKMGKSISILKNQNMFSGLYIGTGVTFGSF